MSGPTGHVAKGGIAKSAESAMRKWAMQLETQQRLSTEPQREQIPHREVHPFLAVSRESGIGTEQLTRGLAAKLGWDVMDKDLLDYIEKTYDTPQGMLEYVDERTTSWLLEALGKWFDPSMVTQSEYVRRLGRVVLMAAHTASVIFVGRGAQFFLPRESGVSVKIIAPVEKRVQRVMARHGLDRSQAKRRMEQTDQSRRDFVQRYFQRDSNDPHLYDVVVNLDRFSVEDATDIIADACHKRFPPT